MSDLQQEKAKLLAILGRLCSRDYVCSHERIAGKLQELLADIQNDFYTVVVLGEFKRGKSTFVNALLGTSLLPMDILPETATINAIMYQENPALQVVRQDGTVETGEVTCDYMKRFSARQENNEAVDVRYIKIGYPAEMLRNRVILVDTPGVSDLDEQRCEVTYEFLPKANAVLFLLDANSPLKKSEKDFIEERLLPQGIDNIIFLLNKYDDVDEDEDEDLLATTQARLNKAFQREVPVYPVSARWALEGLEQGNQSLVEASQIEAVRAQFLKLVGQGRVESAKIAGWKNRLETLLTAIRQEISNEIKICQMDQQEVQKILDGLDALLAEKQRNQQNIKAYTEARKEEIRVMTAKSLQYFNQQLKADILDRVEDYTGADFKTFVEKKITRRIQRQLEAWTGMYGPHINQLLETMERELSRGMSYYFQQRIRLETERGQEVHTRKANIHIVAEDVSKTTLQAGTYAAAGGIALMAVVGGAVMPLIGLAAAPYLRTYMLEKKLAEAKAAAKPEISAQLAKAIMKLSQEVDSYVDARCEAIRQHTEYAYERVLVDFRKNIQQQLENQRMTQAENERHYARLKEEAACMAALYEELTGSTITC